MFNFVISVIFIVIGCCLIIVPPKNILKHDRRAGYHRYHVVLEETGDEEKALVSAGKIYKLLGFLFLVFGAIVLLVSR